MTDSSADLAEFLLARIADDEFRAQACAADQHLLVSLRSISETAPLPGPEVTHIVRWDPARVLAECAAKRAIVEDHGWEYADPYESWKGPEYRAIWGDSRNNRTCKRCGGASPHPNLGATERRDRWPCATLRALASVYSDHPDYRAEWA